MPYKPVRRLASPSAAMLLVVAVLCAVAGIAHVRSFNYPHRGHHFEILAPNGGEEYAPGAIVNVVVKYEKQGSLQGRPRIGSSMELYARDPETWQRAWSYLGTLVARPQYEWEWDDDEGVVAIPVQLPEDLPDRSTCFLKLEVFGANVREQRRTGEFNIIDRR